MTLIVKTDPGRMSRKALHVAAEALSRGGIIVYPTDTVYGLGGNALRRDTVLRIFKVKSRPLDLPVPLAISSRAMAERLAHVSGVAEKLMRAFWPGALTIILTRKKIVPDEVTGGTEGVGLRIPDHAVPLKLIRMVGFPLVATSANIHGHPSPVSVDDAVAQLGDRVDVFIDAGETRGRVPSTVVDLTGSPPAILREGPISKEAIEEIIGGLEGPLKRPS